MTDLDELVAASRESSEWDVESPPHLVTTVLRRGHRRRRLQGVNGGAVVALAAVTLLVIPGHRAGTTRPTTPATAVEPTGPLTQAQKEANAVAEDVKALDAWEYAGADSSINVLPGTYSPWSVPITDRRDHSLLTITKADPGSRSITVPHGPDTDPCWNFDVFPVESPHGVVLTVVNRPHIQGAATTCPTAKEPMHDLIVQLQSPLGDRLVFDGASGIRLRPVAIREATSGVLSFTDATWALHEVSGRGAKTPVPTAVGARVSFDDRTHTIVLTNGVNATSGTYRLTPDGFQTAALVTTMLTEDQSDPGLRQVQRAMRAIATLTGDRDSFGRTAAARVLNEQLIITAGEYTLSFARDSH
ncbi:MAG: hypothetical protein JWM93_2073 [Frankiales bacterium]|nr:hypothetical protein [Frankiales bacterium]